MWMETKTDTDKKPVAPAATHDPGDEEEVVVNVAASDVDASD